MSIKLRQELPGPGSNSTGLQKILGVEFGVALEIWSDKCRVGQSANLGIPFPKEKEEECEAAPSASVPNLCFPLPF